MTKRFRSSRIGRLFCLAVFALVGLPWGVGVALGDDWPTFRGGVTRQGSTSELVAGELRKAWSYKTPAPPKQAWSTAEGRVIESHLLQSRTEYDDSLNPVIVKDRLYVGSSVDHHVHCIDLKGGRSFGVSRPAARCGWRRRSIREGSISAATMGMRTASRRTRGSWFGSFGPRRMSGGCWHAAR